MPGLRRIFRSRRCSHLRAGGILLFIAVLAVSCAKPKSQMALRASISPAQMVANGYDDADSASDGTPDFLRLDDALDQQAFRRWFTFLAEVQYFTPAPQRPSEIVDCAALVRYAYREALRAHDGDWSASSHLVLVPAMESVRKYSFPHTQLGSGLVSRTSGAISAFRPPHWSLRAICQCRNPEKLNTFFVTRDLARALPGDLLFFRRQTSTYAVSQHDLHRQKPDQQKRHRVRGLPHRTAR